MAEEKQNSPEHFLDLIRKSKRGKFKVYMGMSAGVGKTFRMLQEAHALLKSVIDVQIGFIEPHFSPKLCCQLEIVDKVPLFCKRYFS